MANLRRKNGRDKAWKVKYLGVGNESWGCGGSMRPEYYADLYRRYSTYCRNYDGNHLFKIASGASDYDLSLLHIFRSNVKKLYDTELETLVAIGVSAMMHGYMPFNEKEEILVPFRTWRNTNTGRAAAELSELFVYNIPLRWSISHLYQAILDNEAHVKDIKFLTTLAGYVHWQITGEKVLGIGDASGMLPIDLVSYTHLDVYKRQVLLFG